MTCPQCSAVVLVVEDEALIRLDAMLSLEAGGFDVIGACNADQAMLLLERRDDIAVVFTDVNMPGTMDGLKLANIVRDRWPSVCVIVTSGKVRPSSQDLPECGCFISKPYQVEHVASVMQDMLSA
jgi:DNA-binding NtrC family response regulator